MTLRTKIEFSCDMPYDSIEEGGEFIRLPGLTVAEAVVEILQALECEAGPVEDAGDHGWCFPFRFGSVAANCELTVIDGVVAQFFGPAGKKPGLGKARAPDPDYIDLLTRLGAAIEADPRFREVGWFNADELTSQQVGARTPDGAYDSRPLLRTFGPVGDDAIPGGGRFDEELATPAEIAKGDLEYAHPLRRFTARVFDHFVVVGGCVLALAEGLRVPMPVFQARAPTLDYGHYLLLLVVAIGGGALNALFLHRTATTPGKWLLGLKVVRRDGEPLSYAEALRREAEAILVGCAAFVPPLFPLAAAANCVRLLFTNETGWDRRQGLVLRHAPKFVGGTPALLVYLAASWVIALRLFGAFGAAAPVG